MRLSVVNCYCDCGDQSWYQLDMVEVSWDGKSMEGIGLPDEDCTRVFKTIPTLVAWFSALQTTNSRPGPYEYVAINASDSDEETRLKDALIIAIDDVVFVDYADNLKLCEEAQCWNTVKSIRY